RWRDHFRPEALALGMEGTGRAAGDVVKKRWLAERWKEAGRPDLALGLWNGIVRTEEATEEDLFQVGFLLQRLGASRDAAGAYHRLLERDPLHPQGNYNLSLLRLAAGDTNAAVAGLRAAIDGDPRLRTAYFELGILHLQRGEAEAAREVFFDLLMNAEPDSALAMEVRAILRGIAPSGKGR
ncbi:MAG: tetratricopeptide repeat protein, partial [Candidatus Eisenbacteria bacterium]|nr:tetratricopeptide repeat protein [Candidatus Latescibacterota bacterium]MBD3300953.1 tetratricopeptide repeat protein [Candidatus Eisenbacteria bacterium]